MRLDTLTFAMLQVSAQGSFDFEQENEGGNVLASDEDGEEGDEWNDSDGCEPVSLSLLSMHTHLSLLSPLPVSAVLRTQKSFSKAESCRFLN